MILLIIFIYIILDMILWIDCGYCECSHLRFEIQTRRLNTKYSDYDSNFVTSCFPYYEELEEHYNDLWREYYASRF